MSGSGGNRGGSGGRRERTVGDRGRGGCGVRVVLSSWSRGG